MNTNQYKYYYAWGNNEKRKTMKGRKCAVISRGKMNSCLIEFENKQREIVSRNSIRKIKDL
jgi:hypothetical protein